VRNLRDAIRAVIDSASQEGCTDDLCVVEAGPLYILQQEYNLFFVEPEDRQLDVIEKPERLF